MNEQEKESIYIGAVGAVCRMSNASVASGHKGAPAAKN
jgi:hypothetical protein